MKNIFLIILLSVFSCKTTEITTLKVSKNTTNFFFIRHAEKNHDGSKNPNLNTLGQQRALRYVAFFKDIKFDAIYSTNFKRTLNTIKPIAEKSNLKPVIYNPFVIDYATFKTLHKNQTVLIVGHSNTTPSFANKILEKFVYNQMDENNYSNIYKITVKDTIISSELLKMD